MKLNEELGLKRDIEILEHEALLNIYYTGDIIKKQAREFFAKYGITDVQFNVMQLLRHQAGAHDGLTQAELSRMMLVNRSNTTSIIDRMEKAGLVKREGVPSDRRYNSIRLTSEGRKILKQVENKYHNEVSRIMGALRGAELKTMMHMLERIRRRLKDTGSSGKL